MSAATSARFRTFALVFGVFFGIFYVVCDMAALPLFTYHPGTGRIDPGYARARPDEGPAMYWYGWIATSALGAAIAGLVAALLPEKIAGKIPLALTWIVPIALLPVYWVLWKNARNVVNAAAYGSARKWLTVVLAAICWYAFLVGHVVNNVRGFAS